MKSLLALVAISLLSVAASAQLGLMPWPLGKPSPRLHMLCQQGTQGSILVRVELGGYVTGDYELVCDGKGA
jgi:hypothetical protein